MVASKGKPHWLRIVPPTQRYEGVKQLLLQKNLTTVCTEAHCPNLSECWSAGTATFMVLGDVCTRACRFCSVSHGNPKALDETEPARLAEAVKEMRLDYVVITSVDRDDLPDQGAGHFAACIKQVKQLNPNTVVEVLTPDFQGNLDCVKTVLDAKPNVFGQNIETVKRLQSVARDKRANYEQTLFVLEKAKELDASVFTKSALMLGLGETVEEVEETMKDLRSKGVDFLAIGQYLRPSLWHLPVQQYVAPEAFASLEKKGLEMGFKFVAAGPFVRSSYRAGEYFVKNLVGKGSKRVFLPVV